MSNKQRPKFLVAVDGYESGEAAFRWTLNEAKADDRIHLVHGISRNPEPIGIGDTLLPTNNIDDQIRSSRKVLERYLDFCVDAGKKCTAETIAYVGGSTCLAENLSERAESYDVDMVVLGNRGIGSVGRLLMGSVSSTMVNICPKNLVIVKNDL